MLKNVAGIWFESKTAEDEYVVRTYDLGNGHREAVISRPVIWQEVPPELAARLGDDWRAMADRDAADKVKQEEKREANLRRAARRATTRVRRVVKVLALDSLLTLTYRGNMTDLATAKVHLKEFVRRMRRALPGWVYVCAFERQKRGAWHMHIATHKLPLQMSAKNGVKVKSFNVVRAIWRSVTGDLGGNIDQVHRKRWSRHSTARMAAYLSKYMLKAFEDGDQWSNRYSASAGVEIPDAVVTRWRGERLADLIGLVYDECSTGAVDITTWLSRWGDVFYLSTEGPPIS